jgi:hypothetical protein
VEDSLKRLGTGVLAAFFAASLGLTMAAATSASNAAQGNTENNARSIDASAAAIAQATMAPSASPATSPDAADFGSPPSGEIPILFNDRHVYGKPDRLKAGRVLTAIVRGNTILVPMRSVFAQMGASVTYDAASKTVDVRKPGAEVTVTVGKPEVLINGESRPLDVPAQMYHGSVVVPLRVLSEGMGAYVQWVADKRLVVVRYSNAPAATPPPPPPATAAPVPAVTAAPTPPVPSPKPPGVHYERFVVGDYIFSPKVYNSLSPGNSGVSSFHLAAAIEFPLAKLPWMLEGDFRSYRYPHNSNGSGGCAIADGSCVNGIGHQGFVYAPSFQARDDDFDGRFGLKIADPRIYIGIGYLFRNSNYEGGAFQTQIHGLGGGIEKLPDLETPFSLYGSVYYYPSATTNAAQDLGNGTFGQVQYRILKYNIGGTLDLAKTPIYLDFGYLGDRINDKQNAASDETHQGPYAGLGIHF